MCCVVGFNYLWLFGFRCHIRMSSSGTPIESQSTPTSSTPNSSSTKVAVRGKTDPAWAHCREDSVSSKRGKNLICMYCHKVIKGGGINRFKQHLAGIKGEVEQCTRCPPNVSYEMRLVLESTVTKKRKTQQHYDEMNPYGPEFRNYEEQEYMQENDDVQEIPPSYKAKGISIGGGHGKSMHNKDAGRKGKTIGSYFVPRTTTSSQPTIKSVLQSKEAKERCDLAVSKWIMDACIPFNAVNSMYYQPMLDAITGFGGGYKGPNLHDLRGYLLNKNVEEVKNFVHSFQTTWKETGCTIMADGWTDQCRRTLINFLVYCPRGTVFLKSVDASDASKTADMLFKLFKEVVLQVGVENVVHIVTDNAANYVAAGRLLEQEFRTISWSPCAAHCLNLMLQDIGKLDEVNHVVSQASKITKYVYNHCFPLHLMRKHTGGREILRPAPTRFATNFIALQSILAQKDALRAMVVSREWTMSAYAKDSKGRKFVDSVLDSSFWKECAIIVQLTEPLVRVLRLVDSDDRPSMGYLYMAMHKAREELLKRFQRKRKRVDVYLKIIDSRWDRQLHKNLHAAGYWLNPSNQYKSDEMANHRQTISGLLDVIERYAYGNPNLSSKLTNQMKLVRNAERDFGRVTAISDRERMLPGI